MATKSLLLSIPEPIDSESGDRGADAASIRMSLRILSALSRR
jgi:hypothetical protein